MLTYIVAGGWSMFIVIGFSLVLLFAAVRFFLKASPDRLAFVRAMTAAQVFCIVGGVATNLTAALWGVVREQDKTGVFHLDWLLQGFGEAITPAGLGFPLLAVTWLLVAIGVRRAHDVAL